MSPTPLEIGRGECGKGVKGCAFDTKGIRSKSNKQPHVSRATPGSGKVSLAYGGRLSKSLETMWLSWHERAGRSKKDQRKTDADLAEEVSEAVGYQITRPLVNHWFNGRRIPDLNEFIALCGALGADPGEILFNVKVLHQALPKASSAVPAVREAAPTPAYLKVQADRIKRFKANRRRTKIVK